MLNIVNVDIESIFLDPANARKHGKKNLDSIKGSIKKFGQVEPLVVNKENRVVIGGNGRLVAMKELGFKTVSIVEIDINTVDATALGIALNRTGELAEWDLNNLGPLLKDLDIDLLADIGFDAKDLEKLMPELVKEGLCDEDEVPEVTDTRCKPGDLWQLGNHRLLCGDSTNVQHVERLMGGEKADICFTSPPYNASNAGFRKKKNLYKTYDDDIAIEDYEIFISDCLTLAMNSAQFCFFNLQMLSGNKQAIIGWMSQFKRHLADVLIWDKLHGAPAMEPNVCNSQYEFVFVFSRELDANRKIGTKEFRGNVSNVYSGSKQTKNEFSSIHNATFPVHFPEHFVETFCVSNGLVLELFLGSGSTLIACEKTNRRCFGLEIDPHYCDVILARWEKFTGQQTKLLST